MKIQKLSKAREKLLIGAVIFTVLVGAGAGGYVVYQQRYGNQGDTTQGLTIHEYTKEEIEENRKKAATWGTIKSRQGSEMTLQTHDKKTLTLKLTDKTEIYKGETQQPGDEKELKAGTWIENMTYDSETKEVIYVWYYL